MAHPLPTRPATIALPRHDDEIPLHLLGAEFKRLTEQNQSFRAEIIRLTDRLEGANQRARSAESREGHRQRERDEAREGLRATEAEARRLIDSNKSLDLANAQLRSDIAATNTLAKSFKQRADLCQADYERVEAQRDILLEDVRDNWPKARRFECAECAGTGAARLGVVPGHGDPATHPCTDCAGVGWEW